MIRRFIFSLIIFVITIISAPFLFSQENPATLIKKGNELYQKKEFTKAVEVYKKIIELGYKSSDVYFNLGNTFYRLRNTPEAIYWYESAKKLNPDDEDIDYNLRIANIRVVDKFDAVPQFFITQWYFNLLNYYSSNQWALYSVIASWLTFVALGLFIFIWHIGAKKILFMIAVLFFIFTIFSCILANQKYWQEQSNNSAIIFTSSVYVKSSPDDKSTDLFILHEGTKVRITDYVGNWYKIKLPNGTIGWLPKEATKVI